MSSDTIIQIRNLTIKTIRPDPNIPGEFRTEPLLRNIQLSAYPGEIVLLLGGSGTGKSLLTNLMLGFISPYDTGIILENSYTGKPLKPQNFDTPPDHTDAVFQISMEYKKHRFVYNLLDKRYPQKLEGKIGVMFQSLGLFDDLTVAENWEIANDQAITPRRGKEWRSWKENLIQAPSTSSHSTPSLNLPQNVLRCNVNALSGGQKQRVALGRLLAFRPPILIFDEPTSALDIATAKQVVQLIHSAHKGTLGNIEKPTPSQLTIIITHDYENFLEIADRIWFIKNNVSGDEQTIEPYHKTEKGWVKSPTELTCQPEYAIDSVISPLSLLKFPEIKFPDNSLTSQPSNSLTSQPSNSLTSQPSNSLTSQPSNSESSQPSNSLSTQPSNSESSQPSAATHSTPNSQSFTALPLQSTQIQFTLQIPQTQPPVENITSQPTATNLSKNIAENIQSTLYSSSQLLDYFQKQLMTRRHDISNLMKIGDLAQRQAQSNDMVWDNAIPYTFRAIFKSIRPQTYRWWCKFFFIMLKLLILRAIPYIILTGFFLGMVATYFSLNTDLGEVSIGMQDETASNSKNKSAPDSKNEPVKVEVEEFLLPTFYQGILSGFGVVMFRALIPLFTCIFIAARSGTAVTSYLSSMRDPERRQWDSLRNLGIEPYLFFLTQILICFVLGCFILSYISFLASALGSLVVALATNPFCTWYIWVETFWEHLNPQPLGDKIAWIPIFEGFPMFMLKTMCAGCAIAFISFAWGVRSRKSTIDTIRSLIGANIWNMIAVLAIFFVILICELSKNL